MSHLMAYMLDLSYLKNKDYSLSPTTSRTGSQNSIALVEERSNQGKKRRELKVLWSHLQNVQDRISHALNEAGYSSELPEPCLENAQALTFRPPDFCLSTERVETDLQKKVKRTCTLFSDCVKTRNELMKAVYDWMNIIAVELDGRDLRILEAGMMKREQTAGTSRSEVADALLYAKTIISKLRRIGQLVFDEGLDENTYKSGKTERVREDEEIRELIAKYHPQMISNLLSGPRGFAIGINDICDIDEEEMQKLLDELSTRWRSMCGEIWKVLTSVCEIKSLKKPMRLKMAKIMYMFKLLVASLEKRDLEVEELEEEVFDAKSDAVRYKAKLDQVTTECNRLQDKCARAQELVIKISRERDESRSECDKLKQNLESCSDKIVNLDNLVRELKHQSEITHGQSEVTKIVIEDLVKQHSDEMLTMQSTIDKLIQERDEMTADFREKEQNFKEAEMLQGQQIRSTEEKLGQANMMIVELEEKLASVQDTFDQQERQIRRLKMELDAKESTIQKLSLLEEETDSDTDIPVAHGLRPNRSGTSKPPNSPVNDNETSGLDSKRRESMSLLVKQSTNKIGRRSSLSVRSSKPRLQSSSVTFVKAIKVPSSNEVKENQGPEMAEYLRVLNGWRECEEKCKELDAAVEQLEDRLIKTEVRNKKDMAKQTREFRIQSVLAEDRYKADLLAVYNEALNVENSINWYKIELSMQVEGLLLEKVAKEMRNVYNYNPIDDSSNPVANVKIMNQRIDLALSKLANCQQSVIKSMREARDKTMLHAEQSIGLETARHIKVLAEKSREVDRFKKLAESARPELQTLKADLQKVARLNNENHSKLRDIIEEQSKVQQPSKQVPSNFSGSVSAIQKSDSNSYELKQKLETMQSDFLKFKAQYNFMKEALSKETQLRMNVEKAAQNFMDRMKREDGELSGQQKSQPSKAMTRVKILEKLLEMKPTLKLSHVGKHLICEAEESVQAYRREMETSLISLIMKYIAYRRQLDFYKELKKEILSQKAERDFSKHAENLQTAYWRLEAKRDSLKRVEHPQPVSNILKTRRKLDYVFMKVVECLSDLKKGNDRGDSDSSENDFQWLAAKETELSSPAHSVDSKSLYSGIQPVAPSNSCVSAFSLVMLNAGVGRHHETKPRNEQLESRKHVVMEEGSSTRMPISESGTKDTETTYRRTNRLEREQDEKQCTSLGTPAKQSSSSDSLALQQNQNIEKSQALNGDESDSVSDVNKKVPFYAQVNSQWQLLCPGDNSDLRASPEIPRMMQIDMHRTLHKARKHLQDSMQRQTVDDTEAGHSTSSSYNVRLSFPPILAQHVGVLSHAVQRSTNFADRSLQKSPSKLQKPCLEDDDCLVTTHYRRNCDLEIRASPPPFSKGLLESAKKTPKYLSQRRPLHKKNSAESLVRQEIIEKSSRSKERLKIEVKLSPFRGINRSLSGDISSGSSHVVEALRRRRSASDVMTLPSLSSVSELK